LTSDAAGKTVSPQRKRKAQGTQFDMDGNFKMRIGGTPTAPASNDANSGLNGTPTLYRPADMVVDPKTNRLYVADGYGNRRVLIVDADTGKYIGHFGAYGRSMPSAGRMLCQRPLQRSESGVGIIALAPALERMRSGAT
jgi:hypothetical protein